MIKQKMQKKKNNVIEIKEKEEERLNVIQE